MRALLLLGSLRVARAYNGYAVGPDALSYEAAVAYCDGLGGELPSIHSDAENEAARDACGDNVCWLGLRQWGGDAGTHAFEQVWFWPDGSAVSPDTLAHHLAAYGSPDGQPFINWASGEPDYVEYADERHAVMNEGYASPSGLWFAVVADEWSTYLPLCSVNPPTMAPTLSPAPTSSPRPTPAPIPAPNFVCDNDQCGVSEREDCCNEWSEPVCSDGYEVVKFGDHSCLFTCCYSILGRTTVATHEEVTASGHQWEDHEDWGSSSSSGSGSSYLGLLIFYLILWCCVPAALTGVIACACVWGGLCSMCAPPPPVPAGVELTAPATTVAAPQVYKASFVASEGVQSFPPATIPTYLFALNFLFRFTTMLKFTFRKHARIFKGAPRSRRSRSRSRSRT